MFLIKWILYVNVWKNWLSCGRTSLSTYWSQYMHLLSIVMQTVINIPVRLSRWSSRCSSFSTNNYLQRAYFCSLHNRIIDRQRTNFWTVGSLRNQWSNNSRTCKSSLSVCLSFSRYSSSPSLVNSYCKCTLKFISSTEWTTIFTNCIQATMNSMWKLSYCVKYAISVVNLRLSAHTSLKLSNADSIISWPPFTRQIAARSSNTRAFVL